jgi:TolA-binding protein
LGKSHLKLEEMDVAARVFTDLVHRYPDSKFSDKAKKALSEMAEQGLESGEK